jgi:5'-nucleotidase
MTRRFAAALLALLTATFLPAAEAIRPHVLITNDDGIDAPGLTALVDALKTDYRITVAAPARNQSGVGHGVTHHTPVLVEERPGVDGVRRFAVHAQPATCTRLALSALLAVDPPVMVLSGINWGANAGRAAWLSGTVAGAREGASTGLPAVAFSSGRPQAGDPDYAAAARWARLVLLRLREAGLPAPGQLIKVEIPHPTTGIRGVAITRMSTQPPKEDLYEEKAGPAGERLFLSHYEAGDRDVPGTDVQALTDGFVTVTPLSLDQTDYRALPTLMAIPWCSLAPVLKATP